MKFGNLSGAQVSTQSVARFTFYDLPGEPWVMVRPTGDINKAYFAEVLAYSAKSGNRKRLMRGKIDAAMLEQNRQLDRQLIPKHADGGSWGGWLDDETGEEVPYSAESFRQLCEQLPADLFDELRGFCNEPANFRAEEAPDQDDIEATVGNS